MNIDAWMPHSIIFECVVGSRAYGLETADSDYDYRGFCIPPVDYFLLPSMNFEQKDKSWADGHDRTIWNLTKGVELLLNGNPNMLELLFVPDDCVIMTSPYWEALKEVRQDFLSRRIKSTYLGYADSQLKRMPTAFEGVYKPKYASHLVRLLYQGIELLANGTLSVRLPEQHRQTCLSIKLGEWEYKDILALVEDLTWHLKREAETTTLPIEPNRKKVYEVLKYVLCEYFKIRG